MNKLIKKIACMGVVFAMLISSVSCERKSKTKEDSIKISEIFTESKNEYYENSEYFLFVK